MVRKNINPYLKLYTAVCNIGSLKKVNEHDLQIVNKGSLVGEVFVVDERLYVKDVLSNEGKTYEILKDDQIVERQRMGELLPLDVFCYSIYDIDEFKDILDMETKDEIINYLINYNYKNQTNIYWTFLDDKQRKELDEIAKKLN